jgi:hypothetical protein
MVAAAVEDGEDEGAARVVGADRAAAREGYSSRCTGAEVGRHHVRGLEGRHGVRSAAITAARCAAGISDSVAASRLPETFSTASSEHGPFWTRNITQCGNDNSCIGGMRVNTSRAFWESTEFQDPPRAAGDPLFNPTPPGGITYNTRPFVEWCYRIYLRRVGDESGVNFWTNGLNNCINANPNNWYHCYNNTISAFLSSGEYRNRFYTPS